MNEGRIEWLEVESSVFTISTKQRGELSRAVNYPIVSLSRTELDENWADNYATIWFLPNTKGASFKYFHWMDSRWENSRREAGI